MSLTEPFAFWRLIKADKPVLRFDPLEPSADAGVMARVKANIGYAVGVSV